MARHAKPLITVAQLEEATRAVAALEGVRGRIARFQALVGQADNTSVTVHAAEGPENMTLVVPVELLLSELEDEERELLGTLARLGVAIPLPPATAPVQPPLALAAPEAVHAE